MAQLTRFISANVKERFDAIDAGRAEHWLAAAERHKLTIVGGALGRPDVLVWINEIIFLDCRKMH